MSHTVKEEVIFQDNPSLLGLLISFIGAIVLTGGLFLLVPLTQWIDTPSPKKKIIPMQMAVQLPPPTPPPKTMPKVEQIQKNSVTPPKLNKPMPTAQIQNLDVSLSIGLGDALAVGGTSFSVEETEIDVAQNIKEIFTFDDLSTPPRIVNKPKGNFPKELLRRGIRKGEVVIFVKISENGKVTPIKVISSTHPRLEREALRILSESIYTIPLVNGTPQEVQGNLTLNLSP